MKIVSIESLSVSMPTQEDPQASVQDNSVKQVPTGEMYISIRANKETALKGS